MNTIELLEKIKQRPAMWLGKNKLSCLVAFLSGYSVATFTSGHRYSNEDFDFSKFEEWLKTRLQLPNYNLSWSQMIECYSSTEEDALDTFFALFEEYLNESQHQNHP